MLEISYDRIYPNIAYDLHDMQIRIYFWKGLLPFIQDKINSLGILLLMKKLWSMLCEWFWLCLTERNQKKYETYNANDLDVVLDESCFGVIEDGDLQPVDVEVNALQPGQ